MAIIHFITAKMKRNTQYSKSKSDQNVSPILKISTFHCFVLREHFIQHLVNFSASKPKRGGGGAETDRRLGLWRPALDTGDGDIIGETEPRETTCLSMPRERESEMT